MRAHANIARNVVARVRACYIPVLVLLRPSSRRNPAPLAHPRRPSAKPGQPQAVGDLVSRYLERAGIATKVEAASSLAEWSERVGPAIAAVTQPLRVSEGTLFVGVSTSAWLMELNLMKGDLMRHLNAGKGDGRIRQLVFVMMGEPDPAPAGGHGSRYR
jgi:predicted nucleic acid-binding Zn ribbon protein